MDICTKTNKIKLNPSDARVLGEAVHKLRHIGRLDFDNVLGVGNDAKAICEEVNHLLVKMILPGAQAAKKASATTPVATKKV